MRKETEKGPRTKKRHLVYLNKGKQSYFSRSYKTERGAWGAVERLNKRYGHLGYEAVVKPTEEVI